MITTSTKCSFVKLYSVLAYFFILGLLLSYASVASAVCDPGSPPHVSLNINEIQYAVADGNTTRVNFLEITGDNATQDLTCFVLVALDANCEISDTLDLAGQALSNSRFVITDDNATYTTLYGGAANLQDSIVDTGSGAGAFQLIYAPSQVTVGTACGNIAGEKFDAVGHAAADGTSAVTFGGNGNEISPGLNRDAGGSLMRASNTNSGDNADDFIHACQATVTPGADNPGSVTCPELSLSTYSLKFGINPQSITATNTGSVPLGIASATIDSPDFSVSGNDCPASLGAGESCTITVSFIGASTSAGTMKIVEDALDGYQDVSLQACVFCDDFEDGNLTTPLWTPKRSTWSVSGKGEAQTTITSKGDLLSPSFSCSLCSFETVASTAAAGRVSLFAWYTSGSNNVEVRLMQDKAKLFVKQKTGGLAVKKIIPMTVKPDSFYRIKAVYDGKYILIYVDDILQITLTPVGIPGGKALFRVKSPSGVPVKGMYQDLSVF